MEARMKTVYEPYLLGLRLSHQALLRNLGRFIEVVDAPPENLGDFADFVRMFTTFLEVHHDAEEHELFPALRKHGAGKSTDAAHLERWTAEHRDVERARQAMMSAAGRVKGGDRAALAELGRVAVDLRALLIPHVASEEAVLSPAHLPEMIGEQALADVQSASAKKNRSRALGLATFFVHSLQPDEQVALMGDAPWVFRKIALGVFGEWRMARFRGFLQTPSVVL
jgi:hemerythrin-like domain-containing protein